MPEIGNPADMDDAALARQVMAGEHAAFEVLVRRHADAAFRLAWRQLGSREEAEDVVQSVLTRYWKNPKSWNPDAGSRFSTWLYRVILNASTDQLRRRKHTEPIELHPEGLEDNGRNQVEQLSENERRDRTHAALLRLPERQRQAITLVYFEQLSMKEAAEIMEASPKAIESLLGRARATLKTDMGLNELIEEAS